MRKPENQPSLAECSLSGLTRRGGELTLVVGQSLRGEIALSAEYCPLIPFGDRGILAGHAPIAGRNR